jgi:Carboxypeptidase regulatory-like domain/TonB dependent receptor
VRRLILIFIAAGLSLVAQVSTGSVSGYVLDPSDKPVPGASITLNDTLHSLSRSLQTNSSGYYEFDGLAPSQYGLALTVASFAPLTTQVRVEVDQRARLDLRPQLAVQGQNMAVTAQVPAISADSSELGAVLDQRLVGDLPLNERDFLHLALLLPGTTTPVEGSQLSTRGTFAMHVNGGREENNNFLLDGVDNNDSDTRGYVLQPSVDAIQEFKIATNSYSAEYGVASAGQVNVVTRGGGNTFHGSVYDYLRNRDLDARNFFDGSQKPQFIRNQFGSSLGGPVVRKSTFFFASYEGLREDQGQTQLGTVPTAAVRGGNLSSLGTPIFNPFTGQPFANDTIPASLISPYSAQVLALFPQPNLPGDSGNYLGNPIGTNQQDEGTIRIDHRITASAHLSLRYSYGRQNIFEPYAENQTELPGFGDFVYNRGHNALIEYQQTVSARTLNSVLVGFNRAVRQVLVQNHTTNVDQLWGVNYLPETPRDFGYPGISVTGYSRVGDVASLPINRADNTFQVGDTLTMIRGSHSIKIGGELRALQLNGYVEVYSRGQINFTGAFTGSGVGDLLLGLPTLGIQSKYTGPQTLRSKSWSGYFQDDWKATRRLTLNLGVRYSYDSPATDPTNRMATFNFQTGQTVQVGTDGTSRSGTRAQKDEFAPRVGFAWSPFSHTAIRGGYGIYYDSGMFVVNSALYYNPPYFTTSVYFPTATSLITLANPFATSNGIVPPAALSLISPNFVPAYVQDWNLNVQREAGRIGVFSLAYAGSKGTHLPRSLDINQPFPGPGDVGSRAPYPAYSNILMTESGGNSEYQSLQLTFSRHFSGGFQALAAYTFSKSIDDTSAFLPDTADENFPQDSHNYRLERSLSSFDTPQRATAALLYRIPGTSRWTRGFNLSTIITAQSGHPFTPMLSTDNSNTGNTGGNFGVDRPNVLFNPSLPNPTPQEWFNTAAFAIPAQYTWGNAGRNILRGPGLATVDLSLKRSFTLHEGMKLSAEAQAFNLFNRANFNLPDAFADQPLTFGKIFSAGAPRQIQFALRLAF